MRFLFSSFLVLLALVGGVVLLLGGDDDRRLLEIERLSPAARAAECVPKGPFRQAFAAAMARDAQPVNPHFDAAARAGIVRARCLHGKAAPTLQKLARAGGDRAVPFFRAVIDACPLASDDPPACAALDALASLNSIEAGAALAHVARAREKKDAVGLGARLRAFRSASIAKLLSELSGEPDPAVRLELSGLVRARPDPAARPALAQAAAKETDPAVRDGLRLALLQLDHPASCVLESRGESCVYSCPGQAARRSFRPPAQVVCPETLEP